MSSSWTSLADGDRDGGSASQLLGGDAEAATSDAAARTGERIPLLAVQPNLNNSNHGSPTAAAAATTPGGPIKWQGTTQDEAGGGPAGGPDGPRGAGERIASLDQFRGFVVLSMIIMPILGDLEASPPVLGHRNTFFSWADAIMPRFFLMVGFAMELTLRRVLAKHGLRSMVTKQLTRSARLILIGFFYYGLDGFSTFAQLQENWWRLFLQLLYGMEFYQTLTVIGIAQILLLPVIARPLRWRVAYFFALHAVYFVLDYTFWFAYLWQYVDGGSLGAFVYATIMLAGTFFYDWHVWAVRALDVEPGFLGSRACSWRKVQRIALVCLPLLALGVVLMTAGVGLSALPQSWSPACTAANRTFVPCPDESVVSWPFVQPPPETAISMWTLTKRNSTNTFALFSAGWAVPAYLVFFVLSDCFDITVPVLNVLGQSALLMYLLQVVGIDFTTAIFPSDSPAWAIVIMLPISLAVNITIAYYLKRHNIAIRL